MKENCNDLHFVSALIKVWRKKRHSVFKDTDSEEWNLNYLIQSSSRAWISTYNKTADVNILQWLLKQHLIYSSTSGVGEWQFFFFFFLLPAEITIHTDKHRDEWTSHTNVSHAVPKKCP